jgi:hypothetical protein
VSLDKKQLEELRLMMSGLKKEISDEELLAVVEKHFCVFANGAK